MDPREHPNYYAWVVAYIDSDFIGLVDHQLRKYPEYHEVEAYIPTVKILKKKFKGVEHFDDVPLLFNYGFFKIPRKYAIHKDYLDNMQKNISCIYGWVKDPGNARGGNVPTAFATAEEISILIRASSDIGAHSADDLKMLTPNQVIILKGYPWDDVEAVFIRSDEKRKKVVVRIPVLWDKEVEVSMDNVFFTIYHHKSYDPEVTTRNSLDQMSQSSSLDKLTYKNRNRDEDSSK